MKTSPKSLLWQGYDLPPSVRAEIDQLPTLSTNELREKFHELMGYATHSRNRQFLIRKLTWAIQAREFGDISKEARQRAHDLADFRFLRVRLPEHLKASLPQGENLNKRIVLKKRDPRLPRIGSVITKDWRGQQLQVRVLADGFEYEGESFPSLSAVAKHLTDTQINGFKFFGLNGKAAA